MTLSITPTCLSSKQAWIIKPLLLEIKIPAHKPDQLMASSAQAQLTSIRRQNGPQRYLQAADFEGSSQEQEETKVLRNSCGLPLLSPVVASCQQSILQLAPEEFTPTDKAIRGGGGRSKGGLLSFFLGQQQQHGNSHNKSSEGKPRKWAVRYPRG